MKKIIGITVTIVAILALLSFSFIYIKDNYYVMLYIDPNNDTAPYPYLAKVSKKINNIAFKASEITNDNIFGIKTKVIYTDAYGSGTIKNNKTSSDLDYGVGIYLGEFKYNGQNSKQIAYMILRTIQNYHLNLLNELDESDNFFKQTKKYTVLGFRKDNNTIIDILSKGVENTAAGKTYSVTVEGKQFKIPPNEILLMDYNYIKLFTDEISYAKDYRKMLRELTLCTSYYADITDEETGITRSVEIIEETFNGKRFQTNFRQFVPHVYTDISSFDFVQNIVPEDNKHYLSMRLGDYLRHYKDIHFINGIGEVSPLKVVKRISQCSDILAPLIPEDKLKEIRKDISAVLSDNKMALINDYYIGCENLLSITRSKILRETIFNNGKLQELIDEMGSILTEMEKTENIPHEELIPLYKYQQALNNNRNDLDKLMDYIKANTETNEVYIDKLMSVHLKNKEHFIEYSKYLADILRSGGVRIIKLYKDPQNPNIVYVIKDNNSKDIKLSEFDKIGLENAYFTYIYDKNTVFKFIDEKDFKGDILRIDPCWVRYKTTKAEDEKWQEIQEKLIKDKKNYRMKIRFGLIKS